MNIELIEFQMYLLMLATFGLALWGFTWGVLKLFILYIESKC